MKIKIEHTVDWMEIDMKILFIGDIVGSPGRETLKTYLPKLKEHYRPTITIVNGENAAAGKGITEKIYKDFLSWGIQVVTLGNHTWDKRDIFEFIDEAKYLVRPANYPKNNPGTGIVFVKVNQVEIAVINLQGRTFLPAMDSPFEVLDELIKVAKERTNIIFVDFHAEATSEKQALAWYADGRVTAVVGTHTHVQTADERVLPNGTAFMTDVGMTGPYNGILGVEKETIIERFLTNLPARFEVEKNGNNQLNGALITLNEKTGKATKIERIMINDDTPFYG